MSAKLGIVGLIGIGCIVAAAGGGYLALRSNAADLRPVPTVEPAQAATAPADVPVVPNSPEPVAAPDPTPLAPAIVPFRSQPVSTPSAPSAAPKAPAAAPATPPAVAPAVLPVNSADASAASNSAASSGTPVATAAPAPAPTAPLMPPTPPPARYDEVIVAADAVLGLQLDSTISSETARVEDRVNARLSRDVLVDGRVAIPSGARLEGTVTQVDRGGKFKDRPRLGVAFNTLVLADGTRVAIQTDTIFRDGDSPSGQANTKVGGSAVVGAILGAMIGGKKGALLGSTAGAAGGAAAVAAGDRAETKLISGTQLTARLSAPVTVLIERNHEN